MSIKLLVILTTSLEIQKSDTTQRDQAWDIRAYPCIGLGSFLVPQLCRLAVYPEILRRIKDGQALMDVGCFIGHDLRRLVFDGAPSSNLYGADIANHWDVGYEMFRDRDHFEGHFIEADILSPSPALELLEDKIDIVAISQVLHQWDWNGQIKAAKILFSFTKPGSLVVGNQIGNSDAHEVSFKHLGAPNPIWRHNPESLEKFWNQIGSETGTKWKTQAWLRTFEEMSWDPKDAAWMEEGVAVIEFAVERVE
jgi:hypothetical protein